MLDEPLQSVAHGKPCRYCLPALHPPKTQGMARRSSKLRFSARRAGATQCARSRVHSPASPARNTPALQDSPQCASGKTQMRPGHRLHRLIPAVRHFRRWPRRTHQRLQASRNHDLQIPLREHRIGVFPGENFPLLGDANLPGEVSRRLRQNGRVRGPSTPSHGPAPSMKQPQIDPALARCLMQIALRLVQLHVLVSMPPSLLESEYPNMTSCFRPHESSSGRYSDESP